LIQRNKALFLKPQRGFGLKFSKVFVLPLVCIRHCMKSEKSLKKGAIMATIRYILMLNEIMRRESAAAPGAETDITDGNVTLLKGYGGAADVARDVPERDKWAVEQDAMRRFFAMPISPAMPLTPTRLIPAKGDSPILAGYGAKEAKRIGWADLPKSDLTSGKAETLTFEKVAVETFKAVEAAALKGDQMKNLEEKEGDFAGRYFAGRSAGMGFAEEGQGAALGDMGLYGGGFFTAAGTAAPSGDFGASASRRYAAVGSGNLGDTPRVSTGDIKLMAEPAAQQRGISFQQVTPEITMYFGDIRETADTDAVIRRLAERLEEAAASSLTEIAAR
jgi:hypothetical protein